MIESQQHRETLQKLLDRAKREVIAIPLDETPKNYQDRRVEREQRNTDALAYALRAMEERARSCEGCRHWIGERGRDRYTDGMCAREDSPTSGRAVPDCFYCDNWEGMADVREG